MKYETQRHGFQSSCFRCRTTNVQSLWIFRFVRSNAPKDPTNMSILDNAVSVCVYSCSCDTSFHRHFDTVQWAQWEYVCFYIYQAKKKRPSRKRLKLNVLFLFGLSSLCHDIVLTHILGGTWNLLAFLFSPLTLTSQPSLYGSVSKFWRFFFVVVEFLKEEKQNWFYVSSLLILSIYPECLLPSSNEKTTVNFDNVLTMLNWIISWNIYRRTKNNTVSTHQIIQITISVVKTIYLLFHRYDDTHTRPIYSNDAL